MLELLRSPLVDFEIQKEKSHAVTLVMTVLIIVYSGVEVLQSPFSGGFKLANITNSARCLSSIPISQPPVMSQNLKKSPCLE